MKNRKSLRAICLATSLLLMLCGCGSIPTDGSVNHYADPAQSASASQVKIQVDGPKDGASQEEIVRGFLEAGAGASDDYTVARDFLTPRFAETWKPDEKTLVHSDEVAVKNEGTNNQFSVSIPVSTSIDDRGLATSYQASNEQDLKISLELVDGEWRISSAPNATILSRSDFEQVFTPFTLYFYDSTFTYAVPDIRWFADRSTVATSLVRVLLQGPAPYLEGAVNTAVPVGTQLNRNSVPVEGTTASVDVRTLQPASNLPQLDIERFKTQLTQTLSQLNGIQSVRLTEQDQQLNESGLDKYVAPEVNPESSAEVVGFVGKDLVTAENIRDENSLQRVFTSKTAMSEPAIGYKRQNFAYLNAEHSSLYWVQDGESREIMTGEELTAPSFDQYQWLWSSTQAGEIRVIPTGTRNLNSVLKIKGDWLKGQKVTSLKVSRDGARAVIISQNEGSTSIWISGIKRGSDNKPEELLQPIRLGGTDSVTEAEWYSDSAVLLANYNTGRSQIVNLSGQITDNESLDGITEISVATGSETVLATTEDSNVYTLLDGRWSRLDVSIEEPNFTG